MTYQRTLKNSVTFQDQNLGSLQAFVVTWDKTLVPQSTHSVW